MGFDILYMPPIHPIGRLNRKGPNNTVHSEPDDVGSPWAIGSDRGRARRDPPGARHDRGLRRLRRGGQRARPGGRARPGAAGGAGPSVGDRATRSGSPPVRTAPSPTRRTRRRSTRTSIRSTSTTPRRPSTPRCCGSSSTGSAHGITVFRVDNPHTKPVRLLGVADRRGAQDDPGGDVPGRGVHPAGDDARAGQGRVHAVLHVLHLAQRQAGDHRLLRRAGRRPATTCGRASGSTPRTSCRSRCSAGIRRRSRCARCWRRPCRRPGACTPAIELYEHEVLAPGREEYLNSEKFQLRPRDFEAALAAGRVAGAVPGHAEPDPQGAPGAAADEGPVVPRHRQRQPARLLPARRGVRRHGPRGRRAELGRAPTSAPPTCGCRRSGWSGGSEFDVFDELSGDAYRWGQFNAVIINPARSVAHIFTIKHR